MLILAFIDMYVRKCINDLFERISYDLCDHHAKSCVLNHIEWNADWKIAASLLALDSKFFRLGKCKHMNIAVAWSNDNSSLEAGMLQCIVRDPWREDLGSHL